MFDYFQRWSLVTFKDSQSIYLNLPFWCWNRNISELVNTMVADALALWVDRISAAMALIVLRKQVLVFHEPGF